MSEGIAVVKDVCEVVVRITALTLVDPFEEVVNLRLIFGSNVCVVLALPNEV